MNFGIEECIYIWLAERKHWLKKHNVCYDALSDKSMQYMRIIALYNKRTGGWQTSIGVDNTGNINIWHPNVAGKWFHIADSNAFKIIQAEILKNSKSLGKMCLTERNSYMIKKDKKSPKVRAAARRRSVKTKHRREKLAKATAKNAEKRAQKARI